MPDEAHANSWFNSTRLSLSTKEEKLPVLVNQDSGLGSPSQSGLSQFESHTVNLSNNLTVTDALDLRTHTEKMEMLDIPKRSLAAAAAAAVTAVGATAQVTSRTTGTKYAHVNGSSTHEWESHLLRKSMNESNSHMFDLPSRLNDDMPMDYSNRLLTGDNQLFSGKPADCTSGMTGPSIEFLAAFCAAAMSRQTNVTDMRIPLSNVNSQRSYSPENLIPNPDLMMLPYKRNDSPHLVDHSNSYLRGPDWLHRPASSTTLNQSSHVTDMLSQYVPVGSSPVKFTDRVPTVDETAGLEETRSRADDSTPPNTSRTKPSEDYLEQFMRVDQSQNVLWRQLAERFQRTLAPNQCGVCSKVLSCRSALTMHYRVHTGSKPSLDPTASTCPDNPLLQSSPVPTVSNCPSSSTSPSISHHGTSGPSSLPSHWQFPYPIFPFISPISFGQISGQKATGKHPTTYRTKEGEHASGKTVPDPGTRTRGYRNPDEPNWSRMETDYSALDDITMGQTIGNRNESHLYDKFSNMITATLRSCQSNHNNSAGDTVSSTTVTTINNNDVSLVTSTPSNTFLLAAENCT
ncbi:unnamed protein product [Echinostoma caproni]|uniref:C2H2-type domain-containing protein n=1 Tax=Echinostoma caproni TaxID=27848 RepID=A0A183AAK0_9TREM|nr:unnamed protein product [Echinostoma caproni]